MRFHGIIIFLILVGISSIAALAPSNPAQAWWGCKKDYVLQYVKSKKMARCFRHKKIVYMNMALGPLCAGVKLPGITAGATLKVDASGKRDKCVVANTSATAVPRCPGAWKLKVRRGRDRCYVIRKAHEMPVSIRK